MSYVIGIDEVGKGAWAGPLVGATVAAKKDKLWRLLEKGLADSKKLSPLARKKLLPEIYNLAKEIYVEVIEVEVINKLGIAFANKLLFSRLAKKILHIPGSIFVDGRITFECPREYQSVVDGDSQIPVIMAASIVAKVYRDTLMEKLAKDFPSYGFHLHKGYGTKLHKEALSKYGPSPLHRLNFRPIKELSKSEKIIRIT